MTNLNSLFNPKSIAVVGASNDTNKIRGRLLKLLLAGGFDGPVYPVNPSSDQVQGLKAYPSVAELPDPVDLALIAVAESQVMEVLEECAMRKVKAAAIYSAGSNDATRGERLQDHVAAFARRTGMRILGPNAEGFIDAEAGLMATFAPALEIFPPLARDSLRARGRVSIVSQSGAMAFALYSRAAHDHIPIRHVVSTGNESDVEMLEVVDYLVAQGASKAILLFVEGFRDPWRFAEVAARAADAGVVLVVAKVGQTSAGQRAAVSHTAHLTGADTAYEAAFRRYGAIRVQTPEQMLAIAAAISAGALPQGRRVGIVTTSGGAGGWAADICERAGLLVPELEPALQQQLGAIMPEYGSSRNPVDVTASVVEDGGATLMRILEIMDQAPGIDMNLVIVNLVSPKRLAAMEARLAPILASSSRPIVFHSPSHPAAAGMETLARIGGVQLSVDAFAYAMTALDEYRLFREQWLACRPPAPAPATAVRLALPATGGSLGQAQARELLTAYGVAMAPEALVTSTQEAGTVAAQVGWPVVLKVLSPDIPHKTEAGAVALNLVNAAEVERAYERIVANARAYAPQARIDGVQVQKMMPPGREMVIGTVNDPDFGPLVMLGFGGIYIEVLRDVVFGLAPLALNEAHAMIRRLKGRALLEGVRGEPPSDVDALAQLLVSVSNLAAVHAGRIAEIDLNPVLLYPSGKGVVAVDTLLVLKDAQAEAASVAQETARNVA